MQIEKYSFGIGDRFGQEGEAQLEAIIEINDLGYPVVPVWNKSYREHKIVKTDHSKVREEADGAVKKLGWNKSYYVDADHIGLSIVDEFIEYSNFFTIDVAHFIGQKPAAEEKAAFVERYSSYLGPLKIPGIESEYSINREFLAQVADNYLVAITEVKKIYDHIVAKKGAGGFIPEVSMDECELAQQPQELFFILAELKFRKVELQTIAPKFTGLFAKGVDYIGDIHVFRKEFEDDIAVIQFAIRELGLPAGLKLSVHSGSDKFAIYPAIREAIRKFGTGIHVKTAGTTWLEEIIGLASVGGKGLDIAKRVYAGAMARYDELTGPYATVLSIDRSKLPGVDETNSWNSKQFVDALTHNKNCSDYNSGFRQVVHVGYKIAVEMGDEYYNALSTYREIIAKHVKNNILERHLKLLFIG
jgi:hypothetical protein